MSKSVHFHQYLNNKSILGVSRIVVQIGDNGVIESLNKYFKEFDEYKKYKVKSLNKAVDNLKHGKGIRVVEEGHVQNAVIKKAEILYWEDPDNLDGQPYLQPVYLLEGEHEADGKKVPFTAYVPAVDDSLTIPVEYNEIASDPK